MASSNSSMVPVKVLLFMASPESLVSIEKHGRRLVQIVPPHAPDVGALGLPVHVLHALLGQRLGELLIRGIQKILPSDRNPNQPELLIDCRRIRGDRLKNLVHRK